MNLKQNIRKVLMEEYNGRHRLLIKFFDDLFDNLDLVRTEPDICQFNWYDDKGKKIFERNNWGRFWLYGCNEYNLLRINVIGHLGFPADEFNEILINYLNNKYGEQFGGRLIKDIGNERCNPDNFFGN